jgi:archaellum biogenesis ATPase FlaH
MDYELDFDAGPSSIPGGTGILLLHPSIGETDRLDTDFLKNDTDAFLVISTRTTAREVEQKLDHYEVDESRAVILDTLSVERGYSRRGSDDVHYVSSPDDLDGILAQTEAFLESHEGKLRVSVDSLTEMAYYADVESVLTVTERLLELLDEHDAVGLFHLSNEVHDEETIDRFRALFEGVVTLGVDGDIAVEMD